MYQEFEGVEIKAISACVPENSVGNQHFSEMLSEKEIRLFEKTVGIINRRWAGDGITASDLGFHAAEMLFEKLKIDRNEINCLIFVSQTPDYKLPFSSNILQERLKLPKEVLCLDINAGCAGFVQGLSTAFSMAKSADKGKVLFIAAETMSKMLSQKDRGTTMLFGDGAAAIVVENTGDSKKKAFFNFFSDGANADAIIIPDGGYRSPATVESFIAEEDEKMNVKTRLNLSMDGARVFDFTLREIGPGIKHLLEKAGKTAEEVDYFLLHQSNHFIIKQIAAQLGVSMDKMPVNIEHFGNTSGVSIPLLMVSMKAQLDQPRTMLLSGYGVGLNWANCLLENMDIQITDFKEI